MQLLFYFDRFIEILELIIDEPGQSFRKFTSSIIHLAIHQIYPIVGQVGQCLVSRTCKVIRKSL